MFDTESFIAEIQKRPAIYDVNCELYLDRAAKVDAWEQVCEIMVPKWRSLSDELKNAEGERAEVFLAVRRRTAVPASFDFEIYSIYSYCRESPEGQVEKHPGLLYEGAEGTKVAEKQDGRKEEEEVHVL